MKTPRRILVVRTDRIGDVILSTPLLRSLRQSFPEAYIAALVRPYARDLLLHHPHLDAILVDDEVGEHAGRRGFWRQVGSLRSYRFDTALLLLPTERMAWMLFAAGIRTRVGVGMKLYEVLTFMKTVSRHKYIPLRHEADYCLDLGRAIGAVAGDLRTETVVTQDERDRARGMLRTAGCIVEADKPHKIVLLHPGHGRSAPNWNIEHYVALAELCLKDPQTWIVVTGSASEIEFSPPFADLHSPRLVNVIGRMALRELMAMIATSSVVVSSSTGPMHIAASLGIPTVSMFCRMTAASVELWGPKGNRSEIVRPSEHYCASQCPGDPHICQFEGGISVTEVYDRVVRIQQTPPRLR